MAAGETEAFSHKRHAPLKLKCAACHTTVEKAERAGFPQAAQCSVCHTEGTKGPFPTHRVIRLPDFVFFSHARHVATKAECGSCHGDVWSQVVLAKMWAPTMKNCVDCHKVQRATVACTACHELSQ